MKDIFKRVWKDIKEYYPVVIIILIYEIAFDMLFGETCPMRMIFGIPCPGCGVTRAGISLLTLDFSKAASINACIFVVIVFAVWFAIWRYILGKNVLFLRQIIAFVVCFMIIYYIYRMCTVFPNYEPLTINKSSILWRVIELF